jgi:hypothetical protein
MDLGCRIDRDVGNGLECGTDTHLDRRSWLCLVLQGKFDPLKTSSRGSLRGKFGVLGARDTIADDDDICIGSDALEGDRIFILVVSASAIARSCKIGCGLEFDRLIRDCYLPKSAFDAKSIDINFARWRTALWTPIVDRWGLRFRH